MAAVVTAEELLAKMRAREPLRILDIRPPDQRADWWIPGSVAGAEARAGERVVVACAMGRESDAVADALAARGVHAASLAGGMRAWSLAHAAADVPLDHAESRVVQVARLGKGCLSYVVASRGEALVIDASVAPEAYEALAAQRGWRIVAVFDSHLHADHLTRGPALAERTGARYLLPAGAPVAAPHEEVRDGDEIRVGALALRALSVPGHAREEIALSLDGKVLFTGDTLLADSVGRPDLGASPAESERRARDLHASIRRLAKEPSTALVLPGHASAPPALDGLPIAAPLSEALARAPSLADADRFVKTVLADLPPPPAEHELILEMNRAGVLPDDVDEIVAYEAGANRCAAKAPPA